MTKPVYSLLCLFRHRQKKTDCAFAACHHYEWLCREPISRCNRAQCVGQKVWLQPPTIIKDARMLWEWLSYHPSWKRMALSLVLSCLLYTTLRTFRERKKGRGAHATVISGGAFRIRACFQFLSFHAFQMAEVLKRSDIRNYLVIFELHIINASCNQVIQFILE